MPHTPYPLHLRPKVRCLPYLNTTFGAESMIVKSFTWLGFPFGLLVLDILMFLEPFGLLAVLPLPMWLKTFVPAYKATRVIAEVFIESLPQTLLQSYILVVVMGRVHQGERRQTDRRPRVRPRGQRSSLAECSGQVGLLLTSRHLTLKQAPLGPPTWR